MTTRAISRKIRIEGPSRGPDLERGLMVLHAEILRAYRFFNERFWNGKLPTPVIGWEGQPPRAKRLGQYRHAVWKDGDEVRDEIVFYADLCFQFGLRQVLVTLLHEMVHQWQQHHGTPGVEDYHNLEWHKEAARVGLWTTGRRGATEGYYGFDTALKNLKPREDVIPYRVQKTRTHGKMKKYRCACAFSVYVARKRFRGRCEDCGEPFQTETGGKQ